MSPVAVAIDESGNHHVNCVGHQASLMISELFRSPSVSVVFRQDTAISKPNKCWSGVQALSVNLRCWFFLASLTGRWPSRNAVEVRPLSRIGLAGPNGKVWGGFRTATFLAGTCRAGFGTNRATRRAWNGARWWKQSLLPALTGRRVQALFIFPVDDRRTFRTYEPRQ
jgi:hypothetical protein